ETAEPGISVFPNPSTGVYSINLNTTQPVVVEVFNALGQVIVSETVTMADGTPYLLDMSEAAEGNYLLKVTGETGVETHKLQLIR
ncbi:MAG TPA: T9SS type A sorting domain-containing protein, partial [Bacteroidia bacterium]|nr:T9SS type A sorting domain-containing protein [Bacteroidia bacterium]